MAAPAHPGAVLRRLCLEPRGLAPARLAETLRVPEADVLALADESAPVTADLALRLARALGSSPGFWLRLQNNYDLARARRLSADLDLVEALPQPFPEEE